MKTTLRFNASASLNYQKYDAEVVLELAEGEKLTPAEKEKYQKYVNEVAVVKVTELAKMVEAAKEENPELNVDKKVVVAPAVVPATVPTPAPSNAPVSNLDSLKAVDGGKFVRGGNHTLGCATLKELNYIAGLTAKSYENMKLAAQALLASGYTGV